MSNYVFMNIAMFISDAIVAMTVYIKKMNCINDKGNIIVV